MSPFPVGLTNKTARKVDHRFKPGVLDGISPGFIERIAAGNIGFNFFIGIRTHGHLGGAQVGQQGYAVLPGRGHSNGYGDSRVDLVRFAAQAAQHGSRFFRSGRFAQQPAAVRHSGIGGQHHQPRG